jgi:hypothetical protein
MHMQVYGLPVNETNHVVAGSQAPGMQHVPTLLILHKQWHTGF